MTIAVSLGSAYLRRPRTCTEAHRIKVASKVTGEYASVQNVAPPVPKASSASSSGASNAASGDAGALIVHNGSGDAAEGSSSMSSNALTVAGGPTSSNLSLGGRTPEKVCIDFIE